MKKLQFISDSVPIQISVACIALVAVLSLAISCIRKLVEYIKCRSGERSVIFRGYHLDAPECWRMQFPNAKGKHQSPINFRTVMVTHASCRPLIFNHQYFNLPKSLKILNDGYGVLVGSCFDDEYPIVTGGPLKNRYKFNVAQFKWGPTDGEGSEHTVNSERYAMELQLMHIKGERCYEDLDEAATCKAVLYISYFFEITPMDNPYLSPIVEALQHIRQPNCSHVIDPFPLCWLFYPFKTKYYFYQGSITSPPCTEGVDWIVQPEPLSISSKQLRCFRRLVAFDGPMTTNTRPVQKINNRTIYFYD